MTSDNSKFKNCHFFLVFEVSFIFAVNSGSLKFLPKPIRQSSFVPRQLFTTSPFRVRITGFPSTLEKTVTVLLKVPALAAL